jgi:hypothetical protein
MYTSARLYASAMNVNPPVNGTLWEHASREALS